MKNISRRTSFSVVGLVVAAPAILAGTRASAAEFAYKYANDVPNDHATTVRMIEAAARIREETKGRLDIQVFPNSQLGASTALLSQANLGAIDFLSFSGVLAATMVPTFAISGIGFAFPDYDTVWKAMDGDLGARIRASASQTNLVVMEKCWGNGFRHMSSSTRPILSPTDLEGFKIRVPVSPLWTSMFEAFKAAPISLNIAEIYSALQTKIAEGQEGPLAGYWQFKTYEVLKHLSMTGHMWDGLWFFANKRSWRALPDDVRSVAEKHINAAGLLQRKELEDLDKVLTSDLAAKGMTVHEVDREAFRAKLRAAGFYAAWKKKFAPDAWTALEKYSGTIS